MRVRPLLIALFLLPSWSVVAATWKLTVDAGPFDRRSAIVTFDAPATLRGTFVLKGEDGAGMLLQVDESGRGVFIERELAKNTRKTYTVMPAEDPVVRVDTVRDGAVLHLTRGNARIVSYQTTPGPVPAGVSEQFRHGAHLHPIFTPGGRMVTGDYPADHRWHRGVWMAWKKTDFEGRHPDFWNMAKDVGGALTGEVRFASLDSQRSGAVQAGFVSQHRFLDHTSGEVREVLREKWEVAATPLPNSYAIDLVSTQTAAGQSPLKLPKYHYGGLGVRGSAAWDPVEAVTMLTSTGADRAKGDATNGKWVHMGGKVDGKPAGLTVLIHPGNFRFPQSLRLNPKNPQLCVAPSQGGDWAIQPGQPYVSRYRLLVADGMPDPDALERAWNDYATPPQAVVASE
jgi:hypothetical protein